MYRCATRRRESSDVSSRRRKRSCLGAVLKCNRLVRDEIPTRITLRVDRPKSREKEDRRLTEIAARIDGIVHGLEHLGDAHVKLGSIFQVKSILLALPLASIEGAYCCCCWCCFSIGAMREIWLARGKFMCRYSFLSHTHAWCRPIKVCLSVCPSVSLPSFTSAPVCLSVRPSVWVCVGDRLWRLGSGGRPIDRPDSSMGDSHVRKHLPRAAGWPSERRGQPFI